MLSITKMDPVPTLSPLNFRGGGVEIRWPAPQAMLWLQQLRSWSRPSPVIFPKVVLNFFLKKRGIGLFYTSTYCTGHFHNHNRAWSLAVFCDIAIMGRSLKAALGSNLGILAYIRCPGLTALEVCSNIRWRQSNRQLWDNLSPGKVLFRLSIVTGLCPGRKELYSF